MARLASIAATRLPGAEVRKPRINRWALLAVPAVAFLIAFFGYPLVDILRLSVTEPTTGLDNYRDFFGTAAYVTVFLRTLQVAAIVTLVCLVLGYPYAYLMTVVGTRWRNVLLLIVLVPLWTSLLVRTYAWLVLLQDTGVINDILRRTGVGELSLIRNPVGVTIAMTQILLPFMVLPLYATLRKIDRRLLDAAAGLGARPFSAFLRIYVPLSVPGVVAGVTFVFLLALGFYLTPALIGSPREAMLSQLIVQQVSQQLDFGLGGAMAVVLLITALALVGALTILSNRLNRAAA